eukprot:5039567-Pleurochrysis_carterae.AAC.3
MSARLVLDCDCSSSVERQAPADKSTSLAGGDERPSWPPRGYMRRRRHALGCERRSGGARQVIYPAPRKRSSSAECLRGTESDGELQPYKSNQRERIIGCETSFWACHDR